MTSGASDGITVVDVPTCWRLLAGEEVGRLAVSVGHHPDIFPINFTVDDESIVFRTAEGTKLFAMCVGPAVAFEADGYDPDTGEAWSVVVKGRAVEVKVHDVVDDLAFPLFPWSATPKARFVRVVPAEVSGRTFHVVQRRPTPAG